MGLKGLKEKVGGIILTASMLFNGGCIGWKESINWRDARPYETYTESGIRYVERGKEKNQEIVLVHGLGGSAEVFKNQLPYLSENYHVYALDLKGAGFSVKPPNRQHTIRQSAIDLGEFVNESSINKAVFVGHSRGSSVILQYASLYPEKVEAMVLCNPYIDKEHTKMIKPQYSEIVNVPIIWPIFLNLAKIFGDERNVIGNLEHLVYDKKCVTRGMGWTYYWALEFEDGFGNFTKDSINMLDPDLKLSEKERTNLEKIPFIFITGNNDPLLIPIKQHEKEIRLNRTGHMIPFEQPDTLIKIINTAVDNKDRTPEEFVNEVKKHMRGLEGR